jgi:hypothetical protein
MGPQFITLTLDGGEWSASRPGRFTTGERIPGTRCVGVWMCLRVGVDVAEKRNCLSFQESNSGSPAHSLSLYSWKRGIRLVVSHIAFKICSWVRIPLGTVKHVFTVYFVISGVKYWTVENTAT